jgi:hypothetical protein
MRDASSQDAGPERTLATSALVLVSGARAAEAALLTDLRRLLTAGDPQERLQFLRRPVRILVPSRSLRDHLAARLVQELGHATAGVVFHTLRGLALEILDRAGAKVPKGAGLFDVLVQRMAREEAALRADLDDLVDGYRAVSGTVRDLLDADLTHGGVADAADEALAADGPKLAPHSSVERARALIRVADNVGQAQKLLDIGRTTDLVRAAREVLLEHPDPQAALPARAVRVVGFADATGLALDLLATLLSTHSTRLYLDLPPDPGAESLEILEAAFPQVLRERLELVAGATETAEQPPVAESQLECFEAPGSEAEALEAVRRVRALLDSGQKPEGIALVARDLGPYRRCLPYHLEGRGIPFYAPTLRTAPDASGRLAQALLEVLRRRGETPVDRWLEALDLSSLIPATDPVEPGNTAAGAVEMELRLALHSLGAGRLSQVAELQPERLLRRRTDGSLGLPLPMVQELGGREGNAAGEDDGDEESEGSAPKARRRWLAGTLLEAAVDSARRLLARLESWPEDASAERHFEALLELLARDLGHAVDEPAESAEGGLPAPGLPAPGLAAPGLAAPGLAAPGLRVAADLRRSREQIPGILDLSRAEMLLLTEQALVDTGLWGLPGRGGGVRVLDVTDARSLTFDHLFLLGLNRDLFPRAVREDPLLPDDLRRLLRRVLPDTPIKSRGHDEERYLFAQLVSASPRVTLAWQSVDDDGKPRAPSPLLARLRWGRSALPEPHRARTLFDPPAADRSELRRPAREQAVLAGLYGERKDLAALLPLAAADALRATAAISEFPESPETESPETESPKTAEIAVRWARALADGLDEIEPGLPEPPPGPFFGFLGAAPSTGDPRNRELWITHLERFAGCPWQTFLQRLLGVEPIPDPWTALPEINSLLVGQLVHGVLEAIVEDSTGRDSAPPPRTAPRDLSEVLTRAPAEIPWPEEEELERLILERARELLLEEGIGLPGFAYPLARRSRPFLEAARQRLWPEGGPPLRAWGAELVGSVDLPKVPEEAAKGTSGGRRLRFRADLVARRPVADSDDAYPWLVDFKTGRPPSEAQRPETRARHFRRGVAQGRLLQAVAYALAGGCRSGAGAVGSYLFLRPQLAEDHREVTVEAGGGDLGPVFLSAAGTALAGWDAGTFFPRLVDPSTLQEPPRCKWCTVSEACLRGDSGSRRRLVEGAERLAQRSGGNLEPRERAFLDAWNLPLGLAQLVDEDEAERNDPS